MMDSTETKLKALCSEWKKYLGLEHWTTDVQIVRGVEIKDNCGQCDFSFVDEVALIRIKAEEDYHGYFPYDMEVTLVHELLHIILDPVTSGDSIFYEQAIDRIARAFVTLKSKGGLEECQPTGTTRTRG